MIFRSLHPLTRRRLPGGASALALLWLSACGGGDDGPTAPPPPAPPPSASGEWTQMASLPGVTRDRAVAFSIGDRGYVGLGQGTVPGTYQDFWEYDPATDTWTQKADFGGGPRASAAGFSIGEKGFIGTGVSEDETGDGKPLKDFWEYDPETNTWTRRADFGGSARFGAVGFSIAGKGYLGTGKVSLTGGHVSDFWEYDPSTDSWTQRAAVPDPPRQHGVGFAIGDRGYVGLGWSSGHDEAFQDFYEYDPSTDTWSRKADLAGFGRVWAAGFSAGGKGYVGTGNRGRPRPQVGTDRLGDFWEYDPSVDGWVETAGWPSTPRLAPVGFSIGGKGYVGTGWDGNEHHQDLWAFTPP